MTLLVTVYKGSSELDVHDLQELTFGLDAPFIIRGLQRDGI